MITNSFDTIQTAFKELRKKLETIADDLHNANEAKTRLLVIDEVLIALGWEKRDFNPEEVAGHVGYTDYLLKIDDTPRLIIEAKKIGQTFIRPRTHLKQISYKLKFLRTQYGPAITDVLDQAQKYANQNGVPFVMITNGLEWFVVQVRLLPGYEDIDDLNAFYFGNIMLDSFKLELFWDLVSKVSVIDGNLEDQFAQENVIEAEFVQTPQTEIQALYWKKPTQSQYLTECYDYFFTDITDPAIWQMLERCFVSDTRLNQYEGDLKRSLRDSTPSFLPNAKDIEPSTEEDFLHTQTGDKRGQVILITGSVGCGKSTFVSKVLYEEKQRNQKKRQTIKIDLLDDVVDPNQNIVSRLWEKLHDSWLNEMKEAYEYDILTKIFGSELVKLRNGPKSKLFELDRNEYVKAEADLLEQLTRNNEKFITKCFHYYAYKRQHKIVIFLDNVDRASEEYQRQVYNFAHKIAGEANITIIITIRESTFFRGQQGGFLDVRSSDTVYHLQAPNLEQVIARRIRYIEDNMDNDPRASSWKQTRDWDNFKYNIIMHSNKLKSIFLTDKSGRDKLSILASLAWHDVRYFLDLLRNLHYHMGSDNSEWSMREIIGTLIIPTERRWLQFAIPNVFKPSFDNYKCYFLKLRLLIMLIHGIREHEVAQGISLNRLIRFSILYGYQKRWIERSIEELVQTRLIECIELPTEKEYTQKYKVEKSHTFRRSPLAVVMLQEILRNKIYLSLIGNDLPFHSSQSYQKYISALKKVVDTLGEPKLESIALDLIAEDTELAHIVAHYLIQAFADEQPSINLARNIPELAITEKKVQDIIDFFKSFAGISNAHIKTKIPPSFLSQLPLLPFDETILLEAQGEEDKNKLPIKIPHNILNIKVGQSTIVPLIFCALVILSLKGINSANSKTILQVINEGILDDHNKKSRSNIDKALRSPTMEAQGWFIAKPNSFYQLASGWEKYWREIFGEDVVDIN